MNTLRKSLPISLAISVLTLVSVSARAADPDQIDQVTVSAPAVRVVGHDPAMLTPIEQVTVTAHVDFNPVTLTTNSGVALLKDSVVEAARKTCTCADPGLEEDDTCMRAAVKAAEPRIAAAIARARSNANG